MNLHSMKYRIAVTVFILEAVMMSLVLWQTLSYSLESGREQLAANEQVTLDMLSDLARLALLTDEFSELQPYVERVVESPRILRVLVSDYEDIVIVSNFPQDVGVVQPQLTDETIHFWRTQKITNAAGLLGTLSIQFSNDALIAANLEARNLGLGIALSGMLIIAIAGLLMGYLLTRRLQRITDAAMQMAKGNLAVSSRVSGRDELGQLGASFDAMVKRINEDVENILSSKARVQAILDNALEGIITINDKSRITGFNDAAVKMFGYKLDEVIGQPVTMIMPKNPSEAHQQEFKNYLATGEKKVIGQVVQLQGLRKDNTEFPMELAVSTVVLDGVSSFIGMVRDVSQQRASAEKIERDRQHQQVMAEILTLALEPLSLEQQLKSALVTISGIEAFYTNDECSIFLADDATGDLLLIASNGWSEERIALCQRVACGDCLCGQAAETRQLVYADSMDARHSKCLPGMPEHGHYCAPIMHGDILLGVLNIGLVAEHHYSADEAQFVLDITQVLASMIEAQQSEDSLIKLSQAIEQSPVSVVITDTQAHIEYVNPRFCQVTGYSLDEVIGKNPRILQSGETSADGYDEMWRILTSGGEWCGELHNRKKNGELYWESATISAVKDDSGRIINYLAVKEDITEQKRSKEALRVSEERYALAAKGANDGLWDWDLTTDQVYMSPRYQQMLGYGSDDIIKDFNFWFADVYDEDRPLISQAIKRHQQGDTAKLEVEFRMQHQDKTLRWVLCRGLVVCDENGVATRMAGSMSDITERKQTEDELEHRAFYDTLTGLPNRALFMDRLTHSCRQCERQQGICLAVLFIDLDRFKNVNDSLGHQAGDKLLRLVASRLQEVTRPEDTVSRLGGDEFVILLEDVEDIKYVIQVAERIYQNLSEPFTILEQEVFSSASIGIAINNGETLVPEILLRDADTAMYRAKRQGHHYQIFNTEMHAGVVRRLKMETDLRYALERDQLEAWFQPIIRLEDECLTGFEALIRWRHPQQGLITPVQFIPVAEETGLILPIGEWMLEQACEYALQWAKLRPDQPPTVSVNLSGRQFLQADLNKVVERIIGASGLPRETLRLEVTESMLIEDVNVATNILNKFKDYGTRLYIDDFGTGYSSLSYLHQFPFDTLKIDRSFVSRMTQGDGSERIVRTILDLAENYGMDVIAEGVETAEERDILRNMGCHYAQGFFYSHPVPGDEASALFDHSDKRQERKSQ